MPAPRPQPVLINGKNRVADALRQEIEDSPLLIASEAEQAALSVEVQDGRFVFILDGRPLGAARFSGLRPSRIALRALEHLAGYLNVRSLANPYTKLKDTIAVELKRLSRPATKDQPGEAEPLTGEGEAVLIASGRSLVIEVTNKASLPLYFYVLDLDQDIRLAPLYPLSGFGKSTRPGETLAIGYGPEVTITLSAPKNQSEGYDHLVIVGSVSTADLSTISLPALGEKVPPQGDLFGTGSRFDRALRTALTGQVPDAATAVDPKDDWTVVHRTVIVRKAGERAG
ncbi:hypothetical protein [Gloeobacter kilaueensis]|uniref:DUF4384 domain-containing protein n=1 Tax=Gloeobacter kilaueensis (strain ATCC BAA-2537 / CCAP 1431/1 / ULC 316 / JS1) TaxID=1183438 RepID=U5QLR4_GLOK1|nr:hypothetical protein [Gloeobacter kilaueensis]AGY59922.1 hypothetical protein GKIL_3676 [Gloeobacter kilaueensis JS1]